VKPIIIQSEARAELDEAMAYYERQCEGLGLALQGEVEQAVRKIQENPQLGAPYKTAGFRYAIVRRFPYVVYYLELEQAIWVMAIAHGKRRPDYWKRRKPE
jgi:toxin ParE1/3/4